MVLDAAEVGLVRRGKAEEAFRATRTSLSCPSSVRCTTCELGLTIRDEALTPTTGLEMPDEAALPRAMAAVPLESRRAILLLTMPMFSPSLLLMTVPSLVSVKGLRPPALVISTKADLFLNAATPPPLLVDEAALAGLLEASSRDVIALRDRTVMRREVCSVRERG